LKTKDNKKRTNLGHSGGGIGGWGWSANGGVANFAELGDNEVRHVVLEERKRDLCQQQNLRKNERKR